MPFLYPLIQAPMAGGITTPELVAAVSNSGGLGSIGAGYMGAEALRRLIGEVKKRTLRPFSVNLFAREKEGIFAPSSEQKKRVETFWKRVSLDPFVVVQEELPPLEEQLQVLLEEKVPIVSFTFGLLSKRQRDLLQRNGAEIWGTATTPHEAKILQDWGVDAIVCQGQEAGGASRFLCFS